MFHVKHDGEGIFGVSRETCRRLEIYGDLLLRWNSRINPDKPIDRNGNVEPALCRLASACRSNSCGVRRVLSTSDRALDFPGLVLAVATGITFDLIEADHRKAAFLREVAAATGAPIVVVHAVRAEKLELPPADLVTARALAPLADLLVLAAPLLKETGVALFPKGAHAERELTDAEAEWHMRVERHPSVTDPNGVIFRLTEVKRA